MTKSTRYFMAGSAAILAAGLVTGLVAYYAGGGFLALSASTGPDELRYIPADAAVIAYADVGAIMNSELRQRIKQAMPVHEQGQEEFQRETGIDIERDIQYLVAAVTPGTKSGVLVARGNFNPSQLESLAVQHGGTVETYRDKRLISKATGNPEVSSGSLAFLEPGLVAIGDTASIKRAIDAQLTASSVRGNEEIMNLVQQIEVSNNAWAVGRFDVLASQAKLPEQIARQIPPVKWFAAAAHINGGVSGIVRVEATDDQSAELLRRQVNGALAFGEMMSRSDPRAAMALQAIQMSGTGKTVELSFTVPSELLQMVFPKPAVAAPVEPQH